YTPATGQTGNATVTVSVQDSGGTVNAGDDDTSIDQIFTITVQNNTAPSISTISDQTIDEDDNTGALAFTVSDAETRDEDLVVTVSSTNQALIPDGNITLVDLGSGNWTIQATPEANQNGSTTVTIGVTDGLNPSTNQFNVLVNPVNDSPNLTGSIANQTGIEATAFSFQVPANTFTDIDNTDSLTYTVDGLPVWLDFDANNRVLSGIPAADDVGVTTLTVRATDTDNITVGTSFVLTVLASNDNPVNQAPIIDDQIFQLPITSEINSLLGQVEVVDPDQQDNHIFTILEGNSDKRFAIDNDGRITVLTELNDVNPGDQFLLTVEVSDQLGLSDQAQITVVFTTNEQTFNVLPDQYDVDEDNKLTISAEQGLLANDSGFDATLLTSQIEGLPNHGTLLLNPDGSFDYTPEANFNGVDQFSYRVVAENLISHIVDVEIIVNPVNDAPVSEQDNFTTGTSENVSISIQQLLQNDSDVEQDNLTITGIGQPDHGTVLIDENGIIQYIPDNGFSGEDIFTYTLEDGQGGITHGFVKIFVKPILPVFLETLQTNLGLSNPGITSATPLELSHFVLVHQLTNALDNQDSDIVGSVGRVPAALETVEQEHSESDINDVSPINEQEVNGEALMPDIEELNPEQVQAYLSQSIKDYKVQNTTKLSQNSFRQLASEPKFISALDTMKEQMDKNNSEEIIIKGLVGASITISAGSVGWFLRGGSMLASLLSTIPMWKGFDPLPVLSVKPVEAKWQGKEKSLEQQADEIFN
ncbi:MAG: Ig-like domain-containing protein, partial [Methylococcaceae bacterium]